MRVPPSIGVISGVVYLLAELSRYEAPSLGANLLEVRKLNFIITFDHLSLTITPLLQSHDRTVRSRDNHHVPPVDRRRHHPGLHGRHHLRQVHSPQSEVD